MYKNLREFIAALDAAGELVRVAAPVDPELEIAEITDRVSKSPDGGKALLFENTGTGFPVLTNMLGSRRRMAMALGAGSTDEIAERIGTLIGRALSPKETLGDRMRMLPLLGEVSRWMPRTSRGRGECQQVVLTGDGADLSKLPVLKCWPRDGGRFVTLPLVHTVDPDTGARNVGMYRMQIVDARTTGMHWHVHKTGERHYRAYSRRGERMPVSVCLGGDPAYTYAAVAPMPDGLDEYMLAGFLRRRSVKLVKCVTNNIYVPADCDFVIEGYVDPAEAKFMEGPFGDHTGFYSLEDLYPYFHVTAVTHRRDAVYPATVVGIPPQEDAYIAETTEKIFLAPMRLALQPELEDLYLPAAGTAHNLAIVSIDASYAGQALKTASSMWGAGQMMFNKILLVAPAGTDLRDPERMARLLRGCDPERDVLFSRGVLDVLDHATATPGTGGKIALDLTGAAALRPVALPARFDLCDGIGSVDATLAEEWGVLLLGCDAGAEPDMEGFLARNGIGGVNFVVAVDEAVVGMTREELLWHASANVDPGRDVLLSGGRLLIDARTKFPLREGYPRRSPNPVTSSPETVALVDGRWGEYGLGAPLPSPSDRYRRLAVGEEAAMN